MDRDKVTPYKITKRIYMEDRVEVVDQTEPTVVKRTGAGTKLLSWLALLVATLALILAWWAFNRTGEDLEDRIQRGIQESMVNVEQGVDNGAQTIDEGPDGVDEDDTDVVRPESN